MKTLFRRILPLTALSSFLLSCDLFSPSAYAEKLTPVDSIAVFHNMIDAYNTLDKQSFYHSLDSNEFLFIPEDTSLGEEYSVWDFYAESTLTYSMFDELENDYRIPPLILQVDTTYFSASDTHGFIYANYYLQTPIAAYESLSGGLELKIHKRGNYWYITEWKDVPGETLYVAHPAAEEDTVEPIDTVDTIAPWDTDHNWSDFKVYFKTEF
ncbi:hypothetical protein GF359_06450 [candidate division WOR-3 bacterium]|uniref:Uncharacterized protein n=1 Tax=candidate division WOR-3 bacterium TaxID=2052148 RepID=A0A9D5K9X6_UNCW3|nr:hypothetical protein [candidate division WOR-3 bacterium]MBD3364839.1 hypothetical protein [candidate division WOR-3 bacterium]